MEECVWCTTLHLINEKVSLQEDKSVLLTGENGRQLHKHIPLVSWSQEMEMSTTARWVAGHVLATTQVSLILKYANLSFIQ